MDDDDKIVKMTLIAGKMPEKLGTTLENITDLVGKTIVGVAVSNVPSNYGKTYDKNDDTQDGYYHWEDPPDLVTETGIRNRKDELVKSGRF